MGLLLLRVMEYPRVGSGRPMSRSSNFMTIIYPQLAGRSPVILLSTRWSVAGKRGSLISIMKTWRVAFPVTALYRNKYVFNQFQLLMSRKLEEEACAYQQLAV